MFAFATDERVLYVFKTEAEAVAYCEGPDVDSGAWHFYSDSGDPLEAVFSVPVQRSSFSVSQGQYSLRSSAGNSLLDRLHQVQVVEGAAGLDSIAAVQRHLMRH